MNRLGGVMATVALIGVAACSGGDEPAAQPAEVEAAEETLPTLPPVATEAPTTVAPTAPSTTEPEATVELGDWDWGAPCRVPVEQHTGPDVMLPDRTFEVVVSEIDGGYRLDFENVVLDELPFSDAEIAEALLEAVALLPTIVLDEDGRFARFEGLADEIGDLATIAGGSLQGLGEAAEIAESLVLTQTFLAWNGFWQGAQALASTPVTTTETRMIFGWEYEAEVTRSAVQLGSASLVEQYGRSARFAYAEVGADIDVGVGPVAFDIEADAIIDLERARPHESTVWTTLYSMDDGVRGEPFSDSFYRSAFVTTFDWENAVGCE